MINNFGKQFLRNNQQLKAPNVTEYIDQKQMQYRMQEMKKIVEDIKYFAQHYFYIISLDQGKKIIKLYPKQAKLVEQMTQRRRLIALACRQCGKSTAYSVYVLWYCLVNKDKAVLICANKLKTAKDILSRIKMGYEMLPNWLKPGIKTWNATSIQFSNGCKVTAEATSESSGRGGSINLLILDEFAFLSPGLQEGFMNSVFPVVSSSKTSQIIVVSTPNGMNNEYYRIWTKAKLNLQRDIQDEGWYPVQIDWWEVPGRDAKWKAIQMATFNNDQERFNQQYGNCLGGDTVINLQDYQMNIFQSTIAQMFDRMKQENNQHQYYVETPDGYKPFMGITKNRKECVKIYLENGNSIQCSTDHPFMHENSQMIRAYDLKGEKRYLIDKTGSQVKITQIRNIGQQDCYDLINVGQRHIFFANGILTHNSFLGSVATLIKGSRIGEIRKEFEQNVDSIKYQRIQLHPKYPNTLVNIYAPPQRNRAYVIGADPSTGSDSDYQAMTIWDITNTFDIRMVASFYQNDIPPNVFAYMICKLGTIYNNAYVCIENNGVSYATLQFLFRTFEYQNILHLGGNPKTSIGIVSNANRKFEACINFKQFIQNPIRHVSIFDGRLIDQMERFERHNRAGNVPAYYATQGHDDFVMCSVWAFYMLKPQNLQNYYNINKYIPDKLGQDIPLFVTSMQNVSQSQNLQFIKDLDNKFSLSNTNYQKTIDQISQDINKNYQDIARQFSKYDSITESNQNNKENDFEFMGFSS